MDVIENVNRKDKGVSVTQSNGKQEKIKKRTFKKVPRY